MWCYVVGGLLVALGLLDNNTITPANLATSPYVTSMGFYAKVWHASCATMFTYFVKEVLS